MDEFRVGELFSKFYGELTLKTKIPDTGEMHLNVILNYFNKLTLKIISIKLRFVSVKVFICFIDEFFFAENKPKYKHKKTMFKDFCL